MSRIARIKSAMTEAQAEALCRAWLPSGRRKGRAWVCCSPFREERTPSFYVYLTPDVRFHDYGNASDSGDMIDLCERLFHMSKQDALEAFEQMLGINSEHNPKTRPDRREAGA